QPKIDGDRGPAAELARCIGLHVFGTILRQDRDAVAALDPQPYQGVRQAKRPATELGVGDRPPLKDHRRLSGPQLQVPRRKVAEVHRGRSFIPPWLPRPERSASTWEFPGAE